MKNIIQNKIDLDKEENTKDHNSHIKKFVQDTKAAKSPIIQTSTQLKYNINTLIIYYEISHCPRPKRDFISPSRFIVERSFDSNKLWTEPEKLKRILWKFIVFGIPKKVQDKYISVTPIYSRILL